MLSWLNLIFILLFVCCLVLWCSISLSWFVSFPLLGCHWSVFEFSFVIDSISLIFSGMLLSCGLVALYYCCHYFGGFRECWGLYYLMILFLCVMVFLSFSGNLMVSLVFWEYLGLVSFILILYYSNSSGLRASVVTLVSSRFGDVGIFVVFSFFSYCLDLSCGLVALYLCLVILTKSACYPFVSWLIEAMRAPTPVSSLVHSSTLVAAGVWFLLRYWFLFDGMVIWWIFVSCLASIFVSGVCAVCFTDLKKIVAFSTCNNVSWCLLFFVCGDVFLSLCQLLIHGVCKCFLFMSVGDLMSSSESGQEWGGMYSSTYLGWWGTFIRSFLVFSLCGLPFLGVFFTKHYFFCCSLFSYSLFFVVWLFLGFFLTFAYSFRFFMLLLGDKWGLNVGLSICFYMLTFVVFLGSILNFLISGCLEEVFSVGRFWNILLIIVQILGSLFGLYCYEGGLVHLFRGSFLVWGCDSFVSCCYSFYGSLVWIVSNFCFRWEMAVLKSFSLSRFYHFNWFYGSFMGVGWLIVGLVLVLIIYSLVC